jgi:hypothetical protein
VPDAIVVVATLLTGAHGAGSFDVPLPAQLATGVVYVRVSTPGWGETRRLVIMP